MACPWSSPATPPCTALHVFLRHIFMPLFVSMISSSHFFVSMIIYAMNSVLTYMFMRHRCANLRVLAFVAAKRAIARGFIFPLAHP
jgi:hypothetical protein